MYIYILHTQGIKGPINLVLECNTHARENNEQFAFIPGNSLNLYVLKFSLNS